MKSRRIFTGGWLGSSLSIFTRGWYGASSYGIASTSFTTNQSEITFAVKRSNMGFDTKQLGITFRGNNAN
jgi:hypothetical protein